MHATNASEYKPYASHHKQIVAKYSTRGSFGNKNESAYDLFLMLVTVPELLSVFDMRVRG